MVRISRELIMRILISNDDGVLAPGLHVLTKVLSSVFDLEVMAPDRNRSGASNSLTLMRPLRVKHMDNGYYAVDGTPTDCVHLALRGYFDSEFDMVVSGINDGANLGDDVLYSGTVAAAIEGRFLGLPAIAVSMVGTIIENYATAAMVVQKLVQKLKIHRLPAQTILNVNVPDLPWHEIQGVDVTRLGKRHCSAPIAKAYDPRGREMYWIGPSGDQADAGPGTDFFSISQGRVSITPIHVDMTHYTLFDNVSKWMHGIDWT